MLGTALGCLMRSSEILFELGDVLELHPGHAEMSSTGTVLV